MRCDNLLKHAMETVKLLIRDLGNFDETIFGLTLFKL